MPRKTKIVATIGPSSCDYEMVKKLVEAGLDVARLNFSHGDHQFHKENINTIRQVSADLKKPVTILQDLQGPKIRVDELPKGGLTLIPSTTVLLVSSHYYQETLLKYPNECVIPVKLDDLEKSLKPDNRILLDDGIMEMVVTSIKGNIVEANVIIGGKLTSKKGVNLPGAPLLISSFTEKDHKDLLFGIEQGVDVVALSFVHRAQDILRIRKIIKEYSENTIPIIAKLERPEAIENMEEIVLASDGVMIARGDLAVETSPSIVPIIQKKIIKMANRFSRTVITATQMLNSMIDNPRPTRAEASDVANAIFDGTDLIMLSGETAAGKYPVESVKMMDSIVKQAEENFMDWGHVYETAEKHSFDDALSMTRAAKELATDRNVSFVVVFTMSGRTAKLMSKTRPNVPILAFTPNKYTYQQLGMYWGVIPLLSPFSSSVEQMLQSVESNLLSRNIVQNGEQVIVLSGFPVGSICPPNLALLHSIGSIPCDD